MVIDESIFLDKNFNLKEISQSLLEKLDGVLLENQEKIKKDALLIYKKFLNMKQEAPEGMKNELFKAIKGFAQEKINQKSYIDALLLYRFLLTKSKIDATLFHNIAEIFVNIEQKNLAIEFIKLYENLEQNIPLKLITLGNFYNLMLKDYKSAISYYERYLKIDETKAVIYTILASLYAKEYGQISINDQIYYFEKAYKLKPTDRLILHSLAFNYEKLGEKEKANKFYLELLNNSPTPTDMYNYGGFLISCGDLLNGHKYLTSRFLVDDINLQYPIKNPKGEKWDFETDISDKTLLVHYEQGFGDTFMYCRFLPQLKKLAKNVIFIAQKELCELLNFSSKVSEGITIISEVGSLDYDFNMALLDSPCALKTTVDSIPLKDGYLEVKKKNIEDFREKYIKKSKNLKVGLSLHGNLNVNYSSRNIDISKCDKLLALKGIDFYSLNKDEVQNPNIISLSKGLIDFTDTAAAIKNMDLIISTDNVILNLAGALGVKTIGLFNKETNFRWFKLDLDNVGWYNSVSAIQAEENDCWNSVISQCINFVKNYKS
jgi:tetratricopeptide (TPR) repeat protein